MLRNNGEDAGRESHVEQAVGFLLSSLQLRQVAVETHERLISIILAGNVGAQAAEVVQLLFDFLGRGLHVGSDSFDVFIMVHFRSRISDDLDVFGEELVSVL
jgi:hypothetical protein